MTKVVTNVPASIRARLLRCAQELPEDFNLLLQRYAAERFLYRLAESPHRSRFVLKGAMLFAVWGGVLYRTTRDLDLAGFGPSGADALAETLREICAIPCAEDGLEFINDSLQIDPIRDTSEYDGFRARLIANLDGAKVRLQIDIGYGDAIVPGAVDADYPTLLDLPVPRVRAYPREAVVAEKLHAMVVLGAANSRFKDFFDLQYLAVRFEFDRATLAQAVRGTFERRRTAVPPEDPVALTAAFWTDPKRPEQLSAFGRRTGLEIGPNTGEETLAALQPFLLPIVGDLRNGESATGTWLPGGPWR
jgi:hypothetical protein